MDCIDIDALYDERGSVAWTRPILQGDVFRDVYLCGWDTPQTVQIVAHPCAMRRGPDLLSRVTVAPIEPYQHVEGDAWDGHLKVMPLSGLHGDGKSYAARFVDVTAAPSELLDLEKRIASLTNRGIYVLQQRLIKHYTRFTVDIPALRAQAGPILEEAEQEQDWLELILGSDTKRKEAIRSEAMAFDQWLSNGDPSPRSRLQDDANHRDVRRASRAEAVRRRALQSPPPSSPDDHISLS